MNHSTNQAIINSKWKDDSFKKTGHLMFTFACISPLFTAVGTQMNCTINSTSAGIFQWYAYDTLLLSHTTLGDSSKQYSVTLSNLPYSPSHITRVAGQSISNQVAAEVHLGAQIVVSGASLSVPDIVCFNSHVNINSTVVAAKPVRQELLVNLERRKEYAFVLYNYNVFTLM